jgi:outer membrane receptor protein involved in Fe transport
MKRLFLSGFALLLFAFATVAGVAQSTVGQIVGTVKDPTGLLLPGATVTVTNLQTGKMLEIKSNEAGDYLARELPPGNYSVSASFSGFKQVLRTGINLVAFQNVRVDLLLEVGANSDQIVVTAEVPQVDTRSNTLGAVVPTRMLAEMPIADRNIINTLNYTPGVQHVSAGNNVNRNQQRLNVAGNRAYSTNTQLDGASMYFAHRGQGIEMPAPDAIEEVHVITSGVSAQYGRGTAVFTAVTKSGGNQLHGTAWEFIRNDAFDSKPYFATSKPMLRAHDFGATVGGPIMKNRLFYFLSYQGLRIHQQANTATPFTPTAAQRQGDFSALLDTTKLLGTDGAGNKVYKGAIFDPITKNVFVNNQIPTGRFDPVANKIIAMVPQPNLPSGALSYFGSNPTDGDGILGKFDYAVTPNNQLSFRWFWDYRRSVSPFPASPAQSIPGYSPAPTSQDPKTATLNYVRTWSPTLLSTTRGSWTKWVYDEGTLVNTTLADLGATNFVDQYPTKRLPTITVNGYFSATATTIDQRLGQDYGLSQDWDWTHGSHQIKWGALIERISYRKPNSSTSAGTFTFDGAVTKGSGSFASSTGNAIADLVLGTPTKFAQSSGSVSSGHYYPVGFYGQDTWNITKRLTLNLGLRWDIYTSWREHIGQQVTFIPGTQSTKFPTAPAGMIFQSDPQFPYHTAWINFGPRVGFAWDVFGDGRTSVRGGYGISYDPIVAEPLIHGTQPYSLSVTVNTPGPLSNPYKNYASGNPFPYVPNPASAKFKLPSDLEGLRGHFQPMYNQNLSLTVERQISGTWAAQASYVGNMSRHGYGSYEGNPAVYAAGATTATTDSRRIYAPLYTGMTTYSSNLNTSYNSLQTMVTKRASHGLTAQAHYTWSRGIDQCSTEVIGSCGRQNPFNPAGERGAGDFDRTHAAVITYIYELPKLATLPIGLKQVVGGWQVAGYHVFQSGNPYTVLTGSDASLTGVNNDRPNQLSNPYANIPQVSGSIYEINPAAFVANSAGTYGNAARNSLRAPSDWRWDLSAKKVFFPYGERYRVEIRGDFNNILNHTVFDAPANTVSSKSFGIVSSSVVSGRVLRIGAHLDF